MVRICITKIFALCREENCPHLWTFSTEVDAMMVGIAEFMPFFNRKKWVAMELKVHDEGLVDNALRYLG